MTHILHQVCITVFVFCQRIKKTTFYRISDEKPSFFASSGKKRWFFAREFSNVILFCQYFRKLFKGNLKRKENVTLSIKSKIPLKKEIIYFFIGVIIAFYINTMDTVITTENNRNDLLEQSKKNSLLQEVINVLLQIYYQFIFFQVL